MFGITVLMPGVVLSPNMVPHSSSMILLLYSMPYMFLPISEMPPNMSVRTSPLFGLGMNTFFGFFVTSALPLDPVVLDECLGVLDECLVVSDDCLDVLDECLVVSDDCLVGGDRL